MTTEAMPSSLREEIVKIALREVCATLLVDDQPDASRLKECAVAIAEAGAAAYAATISKGAESDKRPSEEGRLLSKPITQFDINRLSNLVLQIVVAVELAPISSGDDPQCQNQNHLAQLVQELQAWPHNPKTDRANDGPSDRLNDGSDLVMQQQPDLAAPV